MSMTFDLSKVSKSKAPYMLIYEELKKAKTVEVITYNINDFLEQWSLYFPLVKLMAAERSRSVYIVKKINS